MNQERGLIFLKIPELSIVLPIYNVELFLNECLESIHNQTFTDWEAILVDDGSTDLSGIICDNWAKKDPRFKVIHQKNAGVSAARNAGIDAAQGELLSFIDPDDFISENFYSDLIFALRKENADFAAGKIKCVEEDGTFSPSWKAKERIEKFLESLFDSQNENITKDIYKGNDSVVDAVAVNTFSCVSWCKVFTRRLWGNARFPVGIDLGEDMMTIPLVMVAADNAVVSRNSLYFWRQRKKSLLHGTVSYERYRKDLWASNEMKKSLIEYAPEKEQDFNFLKLQYDIGCYANYRDTQKKSTCKNTGSKLYQWKELLYFNKEAITDIVEMFQNGGTNE